MNKTKTLLFVLGILVVALVLFAVFHKKPTPPSTISTINAAAILSLTGPAAGDSEEIKRGIELARQDLLKQGITLTMSYEDDNTSPVKSVSAFQKIITTEKPAFLIGPVWSFLGNAVSNQIVSENIPTFQPANTSEFITSENFKPFFFGFPKISYKQALTEQYLKNNNIKTVVIATDSDTWGIAHKAMYERAAQSIGVEIIGNEVLTPGDVSVIDPFLAKYKNNQPDAFLLSDGYDNVDNVFLKRYAQYGYTSLVLGDKSMLASDNKDLALQNGNISILVLVPNPDFVTKYKAVYGVDPNPYSDSAYDGVMMMVAAIQKVGTDPDAMINYMKSSSFSYDGYQTTYQFDEKGDNARTLWQLQKVQ